MTLTGTSTNRVDRDSRRFLAFVRERVPKLLESLLAEVAPRAYTQAYRMLGSSADAEDAVQEAFLQVLRQADDFDGSIPFAAWLGRLVHIAALRVARSRRSRERRERNAPRPEPRESDPDLHEVIRLSVNRLPESLRAAIDLHYFAGLSQDETAVALGLSLNAFGVRLHRAREKLRDLMRAHGAELTTASLVAALSAAPAPASAALAALTVKTISSVSSGSALPATTVPLSLAQKVGLSATLHPLTFIFSAIGLVAIGAALATTAALGAVDPAANPPVKKKIAWTGTAKELLPLIDPTTEVQFACDFAALRQSALKAKPTSLLSDAAVQPTLAHLEHQLRQLELLIPDMPPLVDAVINTQGIVFSAHDKDAKNESDKESLSLIIDLGAAADPLRKWLEPASRWTANVAKLDLAGFSGWTDANFFTGFSGNRWALGQSSMLQHDVTEAPRRHVPHLPTSALWARYDSTDLLADLDRIDEKKLDPFVLSAWFPNWRKDRPALEFTVDTEGEVLSAKTVIDGVSSLPLRPLSRDLSALTTNEHLLELAIGFDPAILTRSLASWFGPEPIEKSTLEAVARKYAESGVTQLVSAFDGDVVIIAMRSQPVPTFTVIAGLGTPDEARRMMGAVSRSLSLSQAGVDRWNLLGPTGLVTVAIKDQAIALTTAGDQIDAALALFNAAKREKQAEYTHLHVDFPTIAGDYLPLLYQLVPSDGIEIENPAGQGLMYLISTCSSAANMMRQEGMTRLSEYERKYPSVSAYMRRQLEPSLTKPFEDMLDTCVSYYRKPGSQMSTDMMVIYRFPDGYRIERYRTMQEKDEHGLPFTRETVAKRLEGWEKIFGPELDQLEVMPLKTYDFPRFDRRCLPDVASVVSNLAPYEMTLRAKDDGFIVDESGLPLAACGAAILSTVGYVVHSETGLRNQYQRSYDLNYGLAAAARNPEKIALFHRIATLFPWAYNDPKESPAAAFIDCAELALADFAPLFGGRTPTRQEVDELGDWKSEQNSGARWVIPLEEGWWAFVSNGSLYICSDPKNPYNGLYQYKPTRETRHRNQQVAPPPAPKPPDASNF